MTAEEAQRVNPDRSCAFIHPGGVRCAATAMPGSPECYAHRPDLAEKRSRASADRGERVLTTPERPALEPWARREREARERRRRANRLAWIRHHERMSELHQDLAAEHDRKALALLDGGEGAR